MSLSRVQIANAMSLALSLGGADGKSGKPAIVAALAALVQDGINAEDVEALLKLTKVIEGLSFYLRRSTQVNMSCLAS